MLLLTRSTILSWRIQGLPLIELEGRRASEVGWKDLYPGSSVTTQDAGAGRCAAPPQDTLSRTAWWNARKVIDQHKKSQLLRIQTLCGEAGLENPEHIAA